MILYYKLGNKQFCVAFREKKEKERERQKQKSRIVNNNVCSPFMHINNYYTLMKILLLNNINNTLQY